MSAETTTIPARLNTGLAAVMLALNLLQLLIVPAILLPQSPWWGLLLIPIVLSTPTLWSLIHEAIHGNLFSGHRQSALGGRVLSVAFGSPFQILRLGHLQHHRFNRTELDRAEVVAGSPPVSFADTARYYARLLGGLYFAELLASPMAILPRRFLRPLMKVVFDGETPDGKTMWPAAKRQLLDEPGHSQMRLDGLIITLLFGASFFLYGAYWWMLMLALIGRSFLISFFDNAYHYANPLDELSAGYNLRLPAWAQACFLNFNFHAAHHRQPGVPWDGLPEVSSKLGCQFADDFVPAALRQLRGPISERHLREGMPGS